MLNFAIYHARNSNKTTHPREMRAFFGGMENDFDDFGVIFGKILGFFLYISFLIEITVKVAGKLAAAIR